MKNLVTSVATAGAGAGATNISTLIVPATSWFPNKVIILRMLVKSTVAGIGGGVSWNITEQVTATGGVTITLPATTANIVAPSTGSIWKELRLIRTDPNLTVVDFGQSMQHSAANQYNGTQYAETMIPSGAAFNYAAPITVTYSVTIPGTLGTSTMGCTFAQALIETGTNLGKLF